MGYFSVSFSFGIMAVQAGVSIFPAALMSLTNLTSAGQFAGIQIIAAAGTFLEMALTQLIINLRYALMSLSLSQKLSEEVTFWQRLVIAFGNTDEIYAVAMGRQKSLTLPYMAGLQLLPILGWTGGTVCGAAAGGAMPLALSSALGVALYGMFVAIVVPAAKKARPILLAVIRTVCGAAAGGAMPLALSSALGVALYGMFVAIVVPAAKKARPILLAVILAAVMSCLIYYVPLFSGISAGMSIIFCTVAASAAAAVLHPVDGEGEEI